MHSPEIIGVLCATCLWQKGEVGASTVERSSFHSAKSKNQTSHNKHAFKQSFKKLWHVWYATHFKAYDMHDMQLLGTHKVNHLAKSRSSKQFKLDTNNFRKYLTSTN